MDREIKFRAWNKDKEVMLYENEDNESSYWNGINANVVGLINHHFQENFHRDLVWMQYTGLTDRNGKKIYEGDILEYTEGSKSAIFKGHIYFQNGAFWLSLENGSTKLLANINKDWLVVIGNKHENPELLNETQ